MKLLTLALGLFSFLSLSLASPFHTGCGPHIKAILDGLTTIGSGVTELDKAVKTVGNKTDPLFIRNLTNNVELSLSSTARHVRTERYFNDHDSKSITAAALKLKPPFEALLKSLVGKKQVIKQANQTIFFQDNFESLHAHTFPLADALEDKTTDADSKSINTAIDQLDNLFESSIKALS